MFGLLARCRLRLEPAAALALRLEPAAVNQCLLGGQLKADTIADQKRGMARGRNYYVKGASNKQDISPEARELLRNKKDPEDGRWQLGYGIQEPLEMDPTTKERKLATQYIVKYKGENINDGEDKVKYYPHVGEEIPNGPPSPVLLVSRAKPLVNEPWFNKNYCQQLGLGEKEQMTKKVILPNIPSVSLILFKIKHLVTITPVTFPNGIPDDFEPDKYGYKLKSNGEFEIYDTLNVDPAEVAKSAEWMKIDREMITNEGWRHWKAPFKSVLGHDNYLRDSRWRDNEKAASQFEKNKKMKWSSKK